MLPRRDGFDLARELHGKSDVPFLFLTARDDARSRIAGFELGADDYVTKPFSPRELTARVSAVLRRATAPPETGRVLRGGGVELDVLSREARMGDTVVALTAKEFDLLAYFLAHPRTAFTRPQLLEAVWGWSYGDASTVTVHVRRVREKIEANPSEPCHLQTVRGIGYRFEP
jgi:DNA-binding response OmpR family regulator